MNSRLRYFLLIFFYSQVCLAQQDTVLIEEVKPEYDPYYRESTDTETQDDFLVISGMDSFEFRKIPGRLMQEMRSDKAFWYAKDSIQKKENLKTSRANQSFINSSWFQTLLWVVIIAGFAGFLIWYLAGSNVGLFKRKSRLIEEPSVDEELSTEDLFAINYQREIDKAIGLGNYRMATRLLFLRLLKNLAEKNIIDYRQGKTNFDYLLQLHPTAYYQDFFRITRNYEYSWYGQFEVGAEKFALIKKDFDLFERRFNR